MSRMRWAKYLWPGLAQLWNRGDGFGLAVAIGFAALLNLTLVASFIWTELFTPEVRNVSWVAVWLLWAGSAMVGYSWDGWRASTRRSAEYDTFGEAQDHYLQGNWYQAQRTLERLLRKNPRDIDARLMLATLLRHTGRREEAAGQLDRLVQLDGSRKWELEIGRERQLLAKAQAQAGSAEQEQEHEQAEADSSHTPAEVRNAA